MKIEEVILLARHFVILSSSYTMGKRIAIHYTGDEAFDLGFLTKQIRKIKEECGEDVSISTHFVEAETETWESLVKADSFFENIEVVNIDEFIALINVDRELCGMDVAKYILSLIKCTHLKLEKLVYLCYADYLQKTNKRLFQDFIYAFKLGPVVDTVYNRYKEYGSELIDDQVINSEHIQELPSRSRILFAKDGEEKLKSIHQTILKYGKYSASKLVEITHRQGTPWEVSYRQEESFVPIQDEVILKYHKNEE